MCQEPIGKTETNEIMLEAVKEQYSDQVWKPGDPIPEPSLTVSARRAAVEQALREQGKD